MIWTELIPTAGSILAAFGGAYLAAHFGFNRWRKQRSVERRDQFVEQVLTDIYETREVYKSVRVPLSVGNEGRSRPRPQTGVDEPDAVARSRDDYFVPIERLHANQELFSRLAVSRFRFMALFGYESGKSFGDLLAVRGQIENAAYMLIQMTPPVLNPETGRAKYNDLIENMESIIWQLQEHDEITIKIDYVVASIEAICRPVIEDGGRHQTAGATLSRLAQGGLGTMFRSLFHRKR